MKTGTSARYRNLAIALITGIGLTAAAVYLAGVVAALPIPGLRGYVRREHWGVLIVTLDVMGALPLALGAWVVGRLLSRALRDQSRRLWMAVALPWLVYGCMGAVEYIHFSGYETSKALSMMTRPLYLTGWIISILSVPAGLWWASRSARAVQGKLEI